MAGGVPGWTAGVFLMRDISLKDALEKIEERFPIGGVERIAGVVWTEGKNKVNS